MMDPPFIMLHNTDMERYRWNTFWTKEPETIAWIDSFQPGDVFWDIGANIGVYSLYAASRARGIRVIAVEPHEQNNRTLHLNRDYNRFSGHPGDFTSMMILSYAMGNEVDMLRLQVPDLASGSTGAQVCLTEGCPVQVETVDNLCELFPVPAHVKIDIDGQELAVVQGMSNTLPRIKSVLVEVNPQNRLAICFLMARAGFDTDNCFNDMAPHSRERRKAEHINVENIVFTRR